MLSPPFGILVVVHPDIDQLASRQNGLVTSAQLAALGLSRASIQHLVRCGWLRPLRRSVYRLQGAGPTWEQAVQAALLAAGVGAVSSHQTAGRLWALPGLDCPELIEITASRWLRLAGVRAHLSQFLTGKDVTRVRNLSVTTPERTLCDLAGSVPPRLLAAMTDAAMRDGLLRLIDLERCLDRLPPTRARQPVLPMRRLLEERKEGPALGDSELEGRAFRALREAGLPDPVAQYRVRMGSSAYLLDLAYPEAKIGIELDGWAFHGSRSAFDADRTRGNALRNANWHILQFTSKSSDAEIVATVVDALALRTFPENDGRGQPRSVVRFGLGDDDVPPIEAVGATVRDDVSGYGRVVRGPVHEKVAAAAAVNAGYDFVG